MVVQHHATAVALVILLVGGLSFIFVWQNMQEGVKNYMSYDREACLRIKFACAPGYEYFADEKGCGCKVHGPEMMPEENKSEVICTPESREGEVCPTIHQPVCGWFNQSIQCIRYPCAVTFGNSCEACHSHEIAYYTNGECPI